MKNDACYTKFKSIKIKWFFWRWISAYHIEDLLWIIWQRLLFNCHQHQISLRTLRDNLRAPPTIDMHMNMKRFYNSLFYNRSDNGNKIFLFLVSSMLRYLSYIFTNDEDNLIDINNNLKPVKRYHCMKITEMILFLQITP